MLIGRAIADITGPAAGNGMMGYSMPGQRSSGIHLRTRARAFVFADPASGNRLAYVVADLGALFQSVHQAVLARLAARFGATYTAQNVLLTATHTHAACGGDSHYAAYNLAIAGFQPRTFEVVVAGIVTAIQRAHDDLAPGSVHLGRGELHDASVNRSRRAFERNPAADRVRFPDGIDPAVTVLRLRRDDGTDIGAIAWFATHGTSMTNKNTLLSGDNKGYACYAWEHDHAGVRYLDGPAGFVAAFPQTNAGDMSPNLNLAPGSGPTDDEFENTRIIGERQFVAALAAWRAADEELRGPIVSRLRYVDFSRLRVAARYATDGRGGRTANAAIGLSMLAGSTEDGPGVRLLREGITRRLRGAAPRPDAPQHPKLVALPFGAMWPHPWCPQVLPLQIVRIGQFCVVGGPAEFTVVAGWRIRQAVAEELGCPPDDVLVQGYSNAYSQYVTTPEEYDAQHYEGASTLFGRDTLPAYQQEFATLAAELRRGAPRDEAAAPPDRIAGQFGLRVGVPADRPPRGRGFGEVRSEPAASYRRGELVVAEFVTGHPRNNLRTESTFLEVQRFADGRWHRHADDGDWETVYRWRRTGPATSKAVISWLIPTDAPPGDYRIVHHGDAKGWTGTITSLRGTTRTFTVH